MNLRFGNVRLGRPLEILVSSVSTGFLLGRLRLFALVSVDAASSTPFTGVSSVGVASTSVVDVSILLTGSDGSKQ